MKKYLVLTMNKVDSADIDRVLSADNYISIHEHIICGTCGTNSWYTWNMWYMWYTKFVVHSMLNI